VPGRLFSVAEHTVNSIPRLFARNERCVCLFETEQGPMAMVLVGAINVSATEVVWHGLVSPGNNDVTQFDYAEGEITLQRGDEMGRFNLGSTVILVTTAGFNWDNAIQPGKNVVMGQPVGRMQV
jgi:phosphatidylserine decarboxylase